MDIDNGLELPAVAWQWWASGLFYGALAILLLYSLYFAVAARQQVQLYYGVLLVGSGLAFACIEGIVRRGPWVPDVNPEPLIFPLALAFALWASLHLLRMLLDLRTEHPLLDDVCREAERLLAVLFVLSALLPAPWRALLVSVAPPMVAGFGLLVSLRCRRAGRYAAGHVPLAFGLLLAGTGLVSIEGLVMAFDSALLLYILQGGLIVIAVLLSMAQVDLLRRRRRARERARAVSWRRLREDYRRLQAFDGDKSHFLYYLGRVLDDPRAVTEAVAVQAGKHPVTGLVDAALCYFELADEEAPLPSGEPVAPMWLVDDILRSRTADIARRHLRVKNRVPAGLVFLAGERRLRRIIDALVEQAIRCSPDGGDIVVGGGVSVGGSEGWLEVCDQRQGLDGPIEELFEPFFIRNVPPAEGEPLLGLPIARRLARLMGGDLQARTPGGGCGARVTLTLPAASAAKTPRHAQQTPDARARPLRHARRRHAELAHR